mmetsp:Transcript_55901/g.118894  ORF Transcript_55901/g.118894 Transcript_55901/m.118894 type:complete len:507 (+) Transcript_55901:180-1700(+)|eukprot:CAMPEP_0172528106 /NCGR_PEP_ID=MMETSP1067-20121228/2605_1 /TAXON_ID=265564 ORGANISM="Thalassiosira punctigera, Strain Tpunct2005C2" /NCGR_SAMPLE_ID=MMETSP1067 /ASSEMBLY_ACC=CAM_ASM_000444 /LENGTH=506 /DNA_ID=CAMNT_0013311971 /DNA_START=139 /DNA_END=1659 /DNA_ORIENTATION=+
MHGQKRAEYKSRLLNPETSTKLATKAQQWNHLSHELSTQRRRLFSQPPPVGADNAGEGDSVAKPSPEILLALTEKMLSVNPDPSHLWNIRREMLLYVPMPMATEITDATSSEDSNITAKSSSTFDIKAELMLTAHCLQRNPKSYSSWYHRKWSLVHFLTHPTMATADNDDTSSAAKVSNLKSMKSILQSELDLCAQFLQMDERNFHCWNYRRFVVALSGSCGGNSSTSTTIQNVDMEIFNGSWSSWLNQSKFPMGAQLSSGATIASGITPPNPEFESEGVYVAISIVPLSKEELEEIITNEWDFTTSKIQDNFSNGSAFHYRSKLLPLILESRLSNDSGGTSKGGCDNAGDCYAATISLAREEWENILLNAIFTEPDDQTPWWYHRFIVSWAKPLDHLDDEIIDEYEALLFDMADSLRELLEVEKENGMLGSNANKEDESKGVKCKWAYIGLHLVLSKLLQSSDSMDEEEAVDLREEAEECLAELITIDPNRKERYQILTGEMKDT